jgi:hypothetical protein
MGINYTGGKLTPSDMEKSLRFFGKYQKLDINHIFWYMVGMLISRSFFDTPDYEYMGFMKIFLDLSSNGDIQMDGRILTLSVLNAHRLNLPSFDSMVDLKDYPETYSSISNIPTTLGNDLPNLLLVFLTDYLQSAILLSNSENDANGIKLSIISLIDTGSSILNISHDETTMVPLAMAIGNLLRIATLHDKIPFLAPLFSEFALLFDNNLIAIRYLYPALELALSQLGNNFPDPYKQLLDLAGILKNIEGNQNIVTFTCGIYIDIFTTSSRYIHRLVQGKETFSNPNIPPLSREEIFYSFRHYFFTNRSATLFKHFKDLSLNNLLEDYDYLLLSTIILLFYTSFSALDLLDLHIKFDIRHKNGLLSNILTNGAFSVIGFFHSLTLLALTGYYTLKGELDAALKHFFEVDYLKIQDDLAIYPMGMLLAKLCRENGCNTEFDMVTERILDYYKQNNFDQRIKEYCLLFNLPLSSFYFPNNDDET